MSFNITSQIRRPYRDRQSLSRTQSRFPMERKRGPAAALCDFCNCFQAPSQHDGTDQGPNVDRSVLALKIMSYSTNEKPGRLDREVVELIVLPLDGEGTCLLLFSARTHTNLVLPAQRVRPTTSENRGHRRAAAHRFRWISVSSLLVPGICLSPVCLCHLPFSGEPLVGAG